MDGCIFNTVEECIIHSFRTALPWQKKNQLTLLITGDNGQKLWRAAIDLYMILNFERV